MRTVFADPYYYLAFVNERDAGHESALELSRTYHGTGCDNRMGADGSG